MRLTNSTFQALRSCISPNSLYALHVHSEQSTVTQSSLSHGFIGLHVMARPQKIYILLVCGRPCRRLYSPATCALDCHFCCMKLRWKQDNTFCRICRSRLFVYKILWFQIRYHGEVESKTKTASVMFMPLAACVLYSFKSHSTLDGYRPNRISAQWKGNNSYVGLWK